MTSFIERDFVLSGPDWSQSHLKIHSVYLENETRVMRGLLSHMNNYPDQAIHQLAHDLVQQVRMHKDDQSPLDAFMQEYDLSSEEGVLLMCIAESLLRIPDSETADALIQDKLGSARWEKHVGQSDSLLVNASTWGLMLTGKLFKQPDLSGKGLKRQLNQLIARTGEPMVRMAIRRAMKIMAHQFVMGRTIKEALKRCHSKAERSYRHSFDMLGEAALTHEDALRYAHAYHEAIDAIGNSLSQELPMECRASISIKLSALHPRYDFTQRDRVLKELGSTLLELVEHARQQGVPVTIDAEEADRLALSLELFEQIYLHTSQQGWNGLGLAVQAYQKRAMNVLQWLQKLAGKHGQLIPVRLVKGAYWDTEIKRCQELGLEDYPVFTRKMNTDVSYLACARFLLDHRQQFYPQFATHNAHTIAAVHEFAGDTEGYEFQRLHGMGRLLYDHVMKDEQLKTPCRVYAPVGSHEDLLPYLVRRLLENGANSSFVNRVVDETLPITAVIEDPVLAVQGLDEIPNPAIPLPVDLFGTFRRNSLGINWADPVQQQRWRDKLKCQGVEKLDIHPLTAQCEKGAEQHPQAIVSPIQPVTLGQWQEPDETCLETCVETARKVQPEWDRTPVGERANILDRIADALEAHADSFLRLCCDEAGKTLQDGTAEVREAADFCRYYAAMARQSLQPITLPGPTGESNRLSYHGRGVFLCISPWNFPLAIFTGQVAAALVTGNTVLAKPAEQTTAVAAKAVELFYQAGIPHEVLQLIPGRGETVGRYLTSHAHIAGVAFTGSTETARAINRALTQRDAPIATLIAETGGQNAMLVDSSALPEQVVKDVMQSAFGSTGQRCSALRVLFLQQEIAPRVLELLQGAMHCLRGGDPALLHTDFGPVIDDEAQAMLEAHLQRMQQEGRLIAKAPLPQLDGHFVAPHVFELESLDLLEREVFGPILHVIRYRAENLDQVIEQVNDTGYGLTLGVHSRIESHYHYVQSRCRTGNCYINRNMIGAMVGVQPFGGEGLSGTGPKAGGPHYLHRFVTERTMTVNTAAIGGNATLLSLNN